MNQRVMTTEAAGEEGLEWTFGTGEDYPRFVLTHLVLAQFVVAGKLLLADVAM